MSRRRAAAVAAVAGGAAALHALLVRPRILRWGSTPAEASAVFPGDELIPAAERSSRSTMATTIAAPPSALWPWLLQMGSDRGGFYSWDLLDNHGRASARQINPEWSQPAVGDRVLCVPDGSVWFDVVVLEPEHAFVLRASLDLHGRPFDRAAPPPRAFTDSTWGFVLLPTNDGGTRLIVRCNGRGRPRALLTIGGWLFWEPAHWVMQIKQFHELRRRCEHPALAPPGAGGPRRTMLSPRPDRAPLRRRRS